MVQKSRAPVVFQNISLRIFLFVAVAVIGFYAGSPFESLLRDTLQYREGCIDFCILQGIGTGIYVLTFSYTFWLGVVFGALGKKVDYLLIGTFAILGLMAFYGLDEKFYLTLIVIGVVGNAIGFVLKVLREQMWSTQSAKKR